MENKLNALQFHLLSECGLILPLEEDISYKLKQIENECKLNAEYALLYAKYISKKEKQHDKNTIVL